jgi:hypothetical protein
MEPNKEDVLHIKQVVSPEILELLTEYILLKTKIKPNRYKNTDALKNVHREYGDPLMEVLLARLTLVVEKALGKALWPTLSFYYTYQHGHELLPHRDRSSCQIVAGLCIAADPEFKAKNGTWPLWLKNADHGVPYHVEYGDLLIFRGHTTEHWREVFSGDWFISAIFGFVEQNGPFAFQKYDQRTSLGQPHVGMFRWTWGCFKAYLQRVGSAQSN